MFLLYFLLAPAAQNPLYLHNASPPYDCSCGLDHVKGSADRDAKVPLEGSPNPVAEDPDLAALHVAGIEANFSAAVDPKDTGIIHMNHALHDNNEVFDPKINDTLIINENIKLQLLQKYPDMNADNSLAPTWGLKN